MSKNDTKIKQMMATVASKKEALGNRPKANWITNATFKSEKLTFNLNVATTDKLVEALSIIILKQKAVSQAAQILGVPLQNEDYDGYSVNDWIADFKTRINIIQWDTNRVALNEMEKKLDSLVSEEAKTEMTLDDIEKALGK